MNADLPARARADCNFLLCRYAEKLVVPIIRAVFRHRSKYKSLAIYPL
jgi:hypothetical protein